MKQVLVRNGVAVVADVPAPNVDPGTVLIQTINSCISVGTEMSGVKASGDPLWKKALHQPDKVKKVLEMALTQGIGKTKRIVEGKLSAGNPTGYSAAGIVRAVGTDIKDISVGDRVACAGAQCAYHAEYVSVPRNLVVRVPDNVSMEAASTVTLGSIALQGLRRAKPTLGETVVVIGLGILGNLAVQMLKANGCKVIGVDLDRARVSRAVTLGVDYGICPDDQDDVQKVWQLTDGNGADAVIVTAATSSDKVLSTAFKMCRKKGRVVLVGDVGLNISRADIYQKELDFFISSSYGPGRYDPKYEEQGQDYPIGYVRWTENRNMQEYLELIADGKLQVEPLVDKVFPVEAAGEAYSMLATGQEKPLMVLLSYSEDTPCQRVIHYSAAGSSKTNVRLAVAGAGNFAKGMHLPNIQNMGDKIELRAVMSRSGHNASATAQQYCASYSTTDYQYLLDDKDIDAILIATRHNLHAPMTLAALKAGKHVLIEKPLALTREELSSIADFYQSKVTEEVPVVLTGFNRRFSAYARNIKEVIKNRTNPMIINYRMNAGYIPLDHWVHTAEGGGRNIGEACHIYDLFTFLTDSPVENITANAIKPATGYYSKTDNFVASIAFADGTVANLTYTSLGAQEFPKEQMEIFVDGMVIKLDDYKNLSFFGGKHKGISSKLADKGQKEELEAFVQTITTGGQWPIPLWQQIQAMEIAFAVEDQIGGKP